MTFIGMYNMLVDKGSAEAYGFKPLDKVKAKFIKDEQGVPKNVSDVAECWEFENNSRGFCSFRDAITNRTDDKFFDTGTYTTAGAPLVADYFEYRYNANDDALDVLYEISTRSTVEDDIKTVKDAFGIDISDTTINPATGLTKGVEDGGKVLLETYKNWEKAVRWVAETDQEAVPSMGVYHQIELGKELYSTDNNKYYVAASEGMSYTLATGAFNPNEIYYVKNTDGTYSTIKLTDNADHVWEPNMYYVLSNKLDNNSQILDPNTEFDALETYYQLIADESASGAKPLAEPKHMVT